MYLVGTDSSATLAISVIELHDATTNHHQQFK